MSRFEGLRRYLRLRLGAREQAWADADEEIRFHLDMRVADLVAAGWDAESARRRAEREFGALPGARRVLRSEAERTERWTRRLDWLRDVRQDAVYAWRKLRRTPAFALAAVLTLALGIGANTAMFSVVHAVLLRPLPYPEADRLVRVWETSPEGDMRNVVSSGSYMEWREQATAFSEVGAHSWSYGLALTALERPVRVTVARVTPSALRVLRTRPALGRAFVPEEGTPEGGSVVMLSHALWRTRFGADPDMIGRSIELDDEPAQVVGVLPPAFDFPSPEVEVLVPLRLGEEDRHYRSHQWHVVARLGGGHTAESARAELGTIAARLAAAYPENMTGWGANVVAYREDLVGDTRPLLLVLLGVVGAVLLLTCVNLANLQLARALGREREIAVRGALGAGRWRLVRQLVTESLLLAGVGGGLALLAVLVGLDALVAVAPSDIPLIDNVRAEPAVLGFGLAITLMSALLFGLVPALRLARPDLIASLRAAHDRGGVRHARLRNTLLVAEVALSLMLLSGAALMLRSMARLNAVDHGFDPQGVLAVGIDVPLNRYGEAEAQRAFYDALLERVAALPGTAAVAGTTEPPIVGYNMTFSFAIEGRPSDRPSGREEDQPLRVVTPGFFRTLRIPLLRGRTFTHADRADATPVVVINDALARKHWPDADPVGERISFEGPAGPWLEIVGVVGDTRWLSPDQDPVAAVYMPHAQVPWSWLSWLTLTVRAEGEPMALAPAIRDIVHGLDDRLPIERLTTVETLYAGSTARRRFATWLMGGFAALALLLGSIGLYGVLAYSVAQRRQEIGIRMALGARRRAVAGAVLRQGLSLTLLGIALGLAGALAVTRFLSSLLFGVSPTDPLSLGVVTLVILAVAAAASWLPARRATRVDPAATLREG